MVKKRQPDNRIERAETIALLASRLRQEIVDSLEARGGEASARELAADLGRPADGLYYHLKLLIKGGLLTELAGESESRYRLNTDGTKPLSLVYRPTKPKNRDAVGRVVESMLRIASKDFGGALSRASTTVEGPRRELWAGRSKGWVNDAELEEINRLLSRLNRLLHKKRKPGRERMVSLCFVLAPLEPKPARRPPPRARHGS